MKILVLGSGVIGTTSAWYLAKAGHEVTGLDSGLFADRVLGPAVVDPPTLTTDLRDVTAIRSDTAIGDAEKELLQVASVPLYKILTVQAAYGRGMATDDRDTLAAIAKYGIADRIGYISTGGGASSWLCPSCA